MSHNLSSFRVNYPNKRESHGKRKWKMKWKLLYIGLYKDHMRHNLNSFKGFYKGSIGDYTSGYEGGTRSLDYGYDQPKKTGPELEACHDENGQHPNYSQNKIRDILGHT